MDILITSAPITKLSELSSVDTVDTYDRQV